MNTIKTIASTNAILAIDLGKYKSVACFFDDEMPRQWAKRRLCRLLILARSVHMIHYFSTFICRS